MSEQREKTTNDENGNNEKVTNEEIVHEESKKSTFEKNKGAEVSKTEEKTRDYKKDDLEEVIITEEKISTKERKYLNDKGKTDKKNIIEKPSAILSLTFLMLPFWFIIAVLLVVSQKQLEKNFDSIANAFNIGISVVFMLLFLGVIVVSMIILFILSLQNGSYMYLGLVKTAFFVSLFITATVGLLYFQSIGNGWEINAVLLYMVLTSLASANAIIALYKWIFLNGELNEHIKYKLSFINKILVGGFGLIATILGIALTIKNLFS